MSLAFCTTDFCYSLYGFFVISIFIRRKTGNITKCFAKIRKIVISHFQSNLTYGKIRIFLNIPLLFSIRFSAI